ncbi:helix-hairpin-helix domain-containing protein [Janibacter cremeus]|uniref:Competence protein ComEA n=1 Tax=Janibacter cremeus TaxID=1285192 RepID=A0A852VMC7_9MICO|nr:helix-hairpin-helix domain-containing protein [Janibacter cremeus]NYF97079.1 competence protein ComEA [Janibacter cremeus]
MSPRASEPSARVAEILDDDEPAVLELPSTVATGRYSVSRRAIVGVALLVALAVAVLGGRYLMARDDAEPEPVAAVAGEGDDSAFDGADSQAEGAGSAPDSAPEGGGTAGEPSAAPDVTVHVVGEVESPGIVSLPGGSRVVDALADAGGETGEADLRGINLARELVDGEQVVVPKPGETPLAAAPPAGGVGGPGGAASPDAPVNLNTADLATLETLSGVGPVLAQRIMDWRLEHGKFVAVEELGEVSGIGEKTYEQLAPKVTV